MPVVVFAHFLLHRKSIPNGVQTQRNFLVIFSRPEDTRWAKKVPEGAPRGAQSTPGVPWWVVPPSGHPPGAALAHCCSFGPEKSTKSFAVFGLRLILISCDVKNKQKTTTGTGHWVNRLVPKNDINLLSNDCKISKNGKIIA